MRIASLPFSSISDAAAASMRSTRSRLRCWLGSRRAAGDLLPRGGSTAVRFMNNPHIRVDRTNTRIYHVLQHEDSSCLSLRRHVMAGSLLNAVTFAAALGSGLMAGLFFV